MRWKKAVAGVLAGLVLSSTALGLAAPADDEETPATQSGLDVKVSPYELRVSPYEIEQSISPLERVEEQGGEKVVALNSDILFDSGSSELSDAAKKRIASLVKDVPKNASVRVEGHTDNVPYKRGNDVLSEERAQAVADAIAGARSDLKLAVKGFGESKPVEPNEKGGKDNPDGRAKNRRVEIRYDG